MVLRKECNHAVHARLIRDQQFTQNGIENKPTLGRDPQAVAVEDHKAAVPNTLKALFVQRLLQFAAGEGMKAAALDPVGEPETEQQQLLPPLARAQRLPPRRAVPAALDRSQPSVGEAVLLHRM